MKYTDFTPYTCKPIPELPSNVHQGRGGSLRTRNNVRTFSTHRKSIQCTRLNCPSAVALAGYFYQKNFKKQTLSYYYNIDLLYQETENIYIYILYIYLHIYTAPWPHEEKMVRRSRKGKAT